MKRKTSETPTRIYTYGCLPPTVGADLAERQFLLAGRAYNVLIEIERRRRDNFRAAELLYPTIRQADQAADSATATLQAAEAVLKVKRAGAGKLANVTGEVALVAACRAAWSQSYSALRAAKVQVLATDPSLRELYGQCDQLAFDEGRAAYADLVGQGLTWHSFNATRESVESAAKAVPMHEQPRFKRYDGTGRIAVQLQNGLPVPAAMAATDTRLRLGPLDPAVYSLRRVQRRRATRTVVSIRGGSNPDPRKTPMWITLPCILHRPLPVDGSIKWVWLTRDRAGLAFVYKLHVVLESASFAPPAEPVGTGTVAVNVGWRVLPNGRQRVAACVDSRGKRWDVLVPIRGRDLKDEEGRIVDRIVQDLGRVDALELDRKERFFKVAQELLGEWVASLGASAPGWLIAGAAKMTRWGSPRRLAGLLGFWHHNRFVGDAQFVATLDAWAERDRHFARWIDHLRSGLLLHRREEYRKKAVRLSTEYAEVRLMNFKSSTVRLVALPEDDVPSAGRRQRRDANSAAPGEFVEIVKRACEKRGAHVVLVDPVNVTQRCHVCGDLTPWDAKIELRHACPACGALWDQDYNACMNMLAACAAVSSSPSPSPLAPSNAPNLVDNLPSDALATSRDATFEMTHSRSVS